MIIYISKRKVKKHNELLMEINKDLECKAKDTIMKT
jgi:hypothetical protein